MIVLFGEKLRFLRVQRHMTQADLARLLGVNRSFINNLEAQRKLPSLTTVLRLAQMFAVAVDYLLRDDLAVDAVVMWQQVPPLEEPETFHCFGAKLRHLRMRRSMTQAEVAAALGLASNSHISFLESDRKEPSVELVLRIADLFGVTTDYLLRDTVAVEDG
jgi:transcriptional regulator with XRE-family HTH domain